ncbi:MAG TPA: hypothetical protein GX401_04795 [Clostridiales bacterium]|nr:hypothetical protein [Clostridiales bacterium]
MNDNFFNLNDTQADTHTFKKLPNELFTNEKYIPMSPLSKLLYALLLDRMGISIMNNWSDHNGRVYIYYTVGEIQEQLGCCFNKVSKLLKELEGADLIVRKRQGLGKPNLIYVKRLCYTSNGSVRTLKKDTSRASQNEAPKLSKTQGNNTKVNKNDNSNTDPSIRDVYEEMMDIMEDNSFSDKSIANTGAMLERVKENIDYDILAKGDNGEFVEELVSIIENVFNGSAKALRIGGDSIPRCQVQRRMLSLNEAHIEYVVERIINNTSHIKNIQAYMLTMLYNAPSTMNSYYMAQVGYDMRDTI